MNLETQFGEVIDALPHPHRLALLPEGLSLWRLLKADPEAYRGQLVRDELLRALYRAQQQQPVAVNDVDYPPMWEQDELGEEF